MENGGERRAMENGGGTMRRLSARDLVMCSTCSGFVFRKAKSSTAIPKPDEEVVEVVTEAEKMRDLVKAVLLRGPLQEMEPAAATKEQWKVLRRRRRILMETKKCPTCSAPLLEACPTCFHSLLQKPERKMKIATTEDEVMVADARSSEHKLKRSREEGKTSSSGLKEKKKAKKSSEMEGSGSKEAKMKGGRLKDDAEIENIIESVGGNRKTKMEIRRLLKKTIEILNEESKSEAKMEDSESAVGNRKTKMVTKRLSKKSIDILKNQPLPKPLVNNTLSVSQRWFDAIAARDKVNCVFLEYMQHHSFIKGHAEYQVEVTDDEGDDHKLV